MIGVAVRILPGSEDPGLRHGVRSAGSSDPASFRATASAPVRCYHPSPCSSTCRSCARVRGLPFTRRQPPMTAWKACTSCACGGRGGTSCACGLTAASASRFPGAARGPRRFASRVSRPHGWRGSARAFAAGARPTRVDRRHDDSAARRARGRHPRPRVWKLRLRGRLRRSIASAIAG